MTVGNGKKEDMPIPEFEVEVHVVIRCKCGCMVEDVYSFGPRDSKGGAVTVWSGPIIELAVGFPMGMFEQQMKEILVKGGLSNG